MNKERENFFIYVVSLVILYFVGVPNFDESSLLDNMFLIINLILLVVFYLLAIVAVVKLINKKDKTLGWSGIGLLILFGVQYIINYIFGFISFGN